MNSLFIDIILGMLAVDLGFLFLYMRLRESNIRFLKEVKKNAT